MLSRLGRMSVGAWWLRMGRVRCIEEMGREGRRWFGNGTRVVRGRDVTEKATDVG